MAKKAPAKQATTVKPSQTPKQAEVAARQRDLGKLRTMITNMEDIPKGLKGPLGQFQAQRAFCGTDANGMLYWRLPSNLDEYVFVHVKKAQTINGVSFGGLCHITPSMWQEFQHREAMQHQHEEEFKNGTKYKKYEPSELIASLDG